MHVNSPATNRTFLCERLVNCMFWLSVPSRFLSGGRDETALLSETVGGADFRAAGIGAEHRGILQLAGSLSKYVLPAATKTGSRRRDQ